MTDATAQLHLGVALTDAGRAVEAEAALRESIRLFDPRRHAAEHATAVNALGAALRGQRRLADAAEAFTRAADAFAAGGRALDEGAARFNLGLVRRELGSRDEAVAELDRAHSLLGAAGEQVRAAAARELGTALFECGVVDRAVTVLEEAIALSERCRDRAGLGAALNVLGLAHLRDGAAGPAVAAFRAAALAHPRGVRPEGFAMAKANLALAYELAGDAPRARLAARQALSLTAAPAVHAQASATAARLGAGTGDLMAVLDDEPPDNRAAVVREELARMADAAPQERRADAREWIDGQLARGDTAVELAQAWLGALLEFPPEAMERVIGATLEALIERDRECRERFRAEVEMAMARFNVPQLLRMKDTFRRLDAHAAWS